MSLSVFACICVLVLISSAIRREDLTRSGPARTYSMPGRSVAAAWDMKGSCKDVTRLAKSLGVLQSSWGNRSEPAWLRAYEQADGCFNLKPSSVLETTSQSHLDNKYRVRVCSVLACSDQRNSKRRMSSFDAVTVLLPASLLECQLLLISDSLDL